jgi:hypothetical protein
MHSDDGTILLRIRSKFDVSDLGREHGHYGSTRCRGESTT